MSKLSRMEQRNSRKKKLVIWFVFTPIVIITALILLVYIQYRSALESSSVESVLDRKDIKFNPVEITDEKYNILLLGIDARDNEYSRTDTIMIAHHDGKTKETKIISVMRDSYVEIPDFGYNKINAAYAYGGVETLRKTLKLNFDLDVHYYAIVDFTSFPKAVDLAFPKGVEIDIEKEMSKGINTTLHSGTHVLSGAQLLDYVRFRKDAESDFGRVRRQQEILKELASEFSEINNLVKLPKILGTITPYIKTNLDNSLIYSIGKSMLFEQERELDSLRVPVDGTYTDERYDHAGLVLELNIEENQQAILNFINE